MSPGRVQSIVRRGALWRVAAAITLALSLATAASAQESAVYTDWNPGFAGFPSNVKRNSTVDCVNGSDACIDRTIAEMYRRFHTVIPICAHNTVFSVTYTRVTEDIRQGLLEGFYRDTRWLNYLDAIFARGYFVAYDNWAAGRRELVPPAWRVTFDAARNKEVSGAGNLLMSMSSHVNRDFPFMLYHVGLRYPNGTSRKPEHDAGNDRLRKMYRPMLTELSHRFDETIDDYDAPGTTYDDEGLFSLLVSWREGAWRNAERLAAAGSDAERRQIGQQIEQGAEAGARELYGQFSYKPGDGPAKRDARCAQYGGQNPLYRRVGGVAEPLLGERGVRLSRRGRVALRLRCPPQGGDCNGAVSLRRGRRRLARKPFSIRAGRHKKVRMRARLGRRNRARLRRRHRLGLRVIVRSRIRPGVTRAVSRRTLLRR